MEANQLNLFSSVLHAYGENASGPLHNIQLYESVAKSLNLSDEEVSRRVRIGTAQASRNVLSQRVRWYQQTLKQAGVIEHVDGSRGLWRLAGKGKSELQRVVPGVAILGFSTKLGLALLGSCDHVFSHIDSPITLALTSPPYPLREQRAYGNPQEHEYIDWLCLMLEPIVKNLRPGGSIALNLGNDIFLPRSPARSMYRERLVLALHDRLGLFKMDELIWENRSKPPGPIQYASLKRIQLHSGYEVVYWLTNQPSFVKSDNRRVLQQHTQRHLDLIHRGGEQRDVINSDGAYRIKTGSYGNVTAGRIPRNVLSYGHRCAAQQAYKKAAREMGLPVHGAPMPLKLASFLIEFLTEPNELVVDPFGGSFTTADAAERLGRRWLSSEVMLEYIVGASSRFVSRPGFEANLMAA